MTRITQSDQVLLLLREQLQRLGRGKAGRPDRARRSGASTPTALTRLQAKGPLHDLPEEEFRRSLVLALLTEELSEAVANDPAFREVVDDVFRIISGSEEGRALLEQASDQLRTASS